PARSAATCPASTRCASTASRSAAPTRSTSSAPSCTAGWSPSAPTPGSSPPRRRWAPVPDRLPLRLRGEGGRPLRVAHLTTVDMSLHLLLATELTVDVESGFETHGISAPGPYVERIERIGVQHR